MAPESYSPNEIITYSSDRSPNGPPNLRLLHYNDVYHVDASSAEPVGGIARFQTLVNYYRDDQRFRDQPELVTLFSGDAFNPSLESSVTKGAWWDSAGRPEDVDGIEASAPSSRSTNHMVPVLNGIGTDCACVGNHDLDFGVTQFRHLASQCTFPWLLANVLDPALGDDVPLGGVQKTTILTSSNGTKIGVIGLVEREWLATINSLPPNLIYKSVSATAKELVPGLREQGAEIVVALTHQREPNDNKLAEKTPKGLIDIILGGHDHFYQHSLINGTHVLRSGSDFKQLSYIEAWRSPDSSGTWDFRIICRDVVSPISQDPPTVQLVEKLTASLRSRLEKPVGYAAAPLDARFTTVRLKESNLGNFVCDLMRFYYRADCCLMAAGTIRGDQIYPPGVLRLKDILNCFPFEDPVVVLGVKGKAVLHALENSVSTYPALEGRFPQVSNIVFEFDPEAPPMSRIKYCDIGGEPVDLERDYVLATRGYMARGKDGYDSLLVRSEGGEAEEIVSEENGVLISMILRQYFMSLKILGKWKMWGPHIGQHWGGVQEKLHSTHPVKGPQVPSQQDMEAFTKAAQTDDAANGQDGADTPLYESDEELSDVKPVPTRVTERERELVIMRKVMRKWWRLAGLKGHPALCDELGEGEFMVNWTKAIAPRVEGRIKQTPREATDAGNG